MHKVYIAGKEYECRPTMGALLRFKNRTGREVSTLKPDEVSLFIEYMYCCVASSYSAANRGEAFPHNLDEFADALPLDVLNDWGQSVAETTTEGQKKT